MNRVWLVENGDVFGGYGLRAVAGSRSEAVAAFWRGYVSASARWNKGAQGCVTLEEFAQVWGLTIAELEMGRAYLGVPDSPEEFEA